MSRRSQVIGKFIIGGTASVDATSAFKAEHLQMPWEPILVGVDGSRARAVVKQIADDLVDETREREGEGRLGSVQDIASLYLAGGDAGVCLFLFAAADSLELSFYREVAQAKLNRAIERAAIGDLDIGFFVGITGLAWVMQLAHRHSATGIDAAAYLSEYIDPCTDVDDVLINLLGSESNWVPFDLVDGIAGIAIYALERLPLPKAKTLLVLCVDRLRRSRIDTPFGAAWPVQRDRLPSYALDTYPPGTFPLGMAHGLAGVIGVMARILTEAPDITGVETLLESGVAFLLHHRYATDAAGWFPRLAIDGKPVGTAGEVSWCWGDTGAAAALLLAARAMRDDNLERVAVETVKRLAVMEPPLGPYMDSCLCHGWAGTAHMFNYFFQATGEELFAIGAKSWMSTVLNHANHLEHVGGLRFKVAKRSGELTMSSCSGLLMGSAGVGLALLAAIGQAEPHWGRAFLMGGAAKPNPVQSTVPGPTSQNRFG